MRIPIGLLGIGVAALVVVLAGMAGAWTDRAQATGLDTPVVLALGDSLAAGVGASDPETTGYPALIRDRVQAITGLETELWNMAVPRETTASMIADGQLAAAAEFLQSRHDVGLVTLNIGGNDAFALLAACAGGFSPACQEAFASALGAVGENLGQILGTLRAAAVPGTSIVIGTYANALLNPGCEFNAVAQLGDLVLDGSTALGVSTGLNDVIRGVAAATGVAVADASFALRDPDLWQPDCLYYNDAGYAAFAARFNAVYTLGPTGLPNTGSGGLAEAGETTRATVGAVVASVVVLLGAGLLVRRRRSGVGKGG